MTIWFFGDSWPAGCELAPQGQDDPGRAFPALVGNKLDVPIKNYSSQGTSQPYMLEIFQDLKLAVGDVAIFCCTAKTRRSYRDKENNIVDIQFNADELYVNPYEDVRISAQTCALLYFLCKHYQVTPFFLNLFDCGRYAHPLEQFVPLDNWLIPPKESVISFLFDPIFFHRWADHHNGNFREWLARNCELVEKFIRPNEAHPNLHGHEVIAEHIVTQLRQKEHLWKKTNQ